MPEGQVTVAGRVRKGDRLMVDGRPITIVAVRKAAGRKPSVGENLHLVGPDQQVVRCNSTDAVRILPGS